MSEPPKYRDLDRVEQKIDDLSEKLDRLILDPDHGVYARIQRLETGAAVHAVDDEAKLEALQEGVKSVNGKIKIAAGALLALATAVGGSAYPAVVNVLKGLF